MRWWRWCPRPRLNRPRLTASLHALFSWRLWAWVALWTVLGQMNFTQISAAVEQANFWWFLAALVFSLATYVAPV